MNRVQYFKKLLSTITAIDIYVGDIEDEEMGKSLLEEFYKYTDNSIVIIDDFYIENPNETIQILELITKRVLYVYEYLKGLNQPTQLETVIMISCKGWVLDVYHYYKVCEDKVLELFSKKEIKEKQTIKRNFLTDKQKELITLLLSKGYKDSHIYRFLVEDAQFITLSESNYIEYLNNEHNTNYKPTKRFTQSKDLQIRDELKETFNKWMKDNP